MKNNRKQLQMEPLLQTISSAERKKEKITEERTEKEKVTEEGQRVRQEMKSDVDSCY